MALQSRSRITRLVLILTVVVLVVGGVRWLGRPVETIARAEDQLERPVLAFDRWDGESWVLVEWGDIIIFDHLVLDWISIAMPPTPRWQWTGNWSTIAPTRDPASVAVSKVNDDFVLFGQVNNAQITSIEVLENGIRTRYPVAAPGYILRLEGQPTTPTATRWLNMDGREIWSADTIPEG